MRRISALARIAFREALSEPLAAVLFLSATMLVHLLPAFHYHQMGDPARFPTECGQSALVVFGLAFALPAARRAIGRELASGTAAVAFAVGTDRRLFFLGRLLGVLAAVLLFAVTIGSATVTSVVSAVWATDVREGVARVSGPLLAAGTVGTLAAFALAAAANRFLRVRFCAAACYGMAAVNVGTAAWALAACATGSVPGGAAFGSLAFGVMAFATLAAALSLFAEQAVGLALAAAVASFFIPVKPLAPPEGDRVPAVLCSAGVLGLSAALGLACIRRKELP